MPTKIRLQRKGKKGQPFYHVVIADGRAPRDGKFIEKIGTYNPLVKPADIDLDFDRALYWLQTGAQPTDTVRNILSYKGILYKNHLQNGVKKGALTQEQADAKFDGWLKDKEEKIAGKVSETETETRDDKKKRMDAERKVNEDRAKMLAERRLAELEADEETTEEAAEEAVAAETTEEVVAEEKVEEKAEAVAEEKVEEVVAEEKTKPEAKEEKAEEPKEEKKEEVVEAKKEEKPAEEKVEAPAETKKEEKAPEVKAEAAEKKAKEEPAKEEPAKEEPAKEEPAKEEDKKEKKAE